VLNTNRPGHPGTVIEEQGPENPKRITSVAYKEGQFVLTLTSTRMFEEVGFLSRVFQICAQHGVVVDMVSTSEVRVSITANSREPLMAAAAELGAFGTVEVLEGRTILAVVGQHLASRAGLGAEILRSIGDAGVNVEMISYAAGSINFSMVIADKDIAKAVATLHRVLFAG
jgi:aspartate kinase